MTRCADCLPGEDLEAATDPAWHDNCPRCSRCGDHRHGGPCDNRPTLLWWTLVEKAMGR